MRLVRIRKLIIGGVTAIEALSLCCCTEQKVEQPVHTITVTDDCPNLSESIIGIDFLDAVADFGQPEFCYYFLATASESPDTTELSVLEAIWQLERSTTDNAQDIYSAAIETAASPSDSGTPSATLTIDFCLRNGKYQATQVAINL